MIKKCFEFLNDNFNVKTYFIKKMNRETYESYMLPNDLNDEIKAAYKQNVLSNITDKNIVEYDFIYDDKTGLAVVDATNLAIKDKILNAISTNKRKKLKRANFSDDYSFIVFELERSKNNKIEKLYLFAKYEKTKSWYKKGFMLGFLGDTAVEKMTDIIVLNGRVDSVLIDGTMLVLNSRGFESIFNYYEKAKELLETNKESIINWQFLSDGDKFYEKIVGGKTRTKKFASALVKSKTDWNNLDRNIVKQVLQSDERFREIEFDEEKRIIVNDKNVDIVIDMIREVYSKQLFTNDIIETKGV